MAEIRILSRAIANDPTKRISDIVVPWKEGEDGPTKDLKFQDIVELIANLEEAPGELNNARKLGLLQAVKDSLIAKTAPATGLTVSYTALVSGSQRGGEQEATFDLARVAYGNLESKAKWHRRLIEALAFFAVILALFAAWEATKASLGKDLLQSLDTLHVQQTSLVDAKTKEELKSDGDYAKSLEYLNGSSGNIAINMIPLCDRSDFIRLHYSADYAKSFPPENDGTPRGIRLGLSATERDLCGKDEVLRTNLGIVHVELLRYMDFWPAMVGGTFSTVGNAVGTARHIAAHAGHWVEVEFGVASDSGKPGQLPCGNCGVDAGKMCGVGGANPCNDVEFAVAPAVRVITSYTLPLVFGIIGSLLYVILRHYTSMSANTLNPRDKSLTYLRVILGFVVAACVSLLISSYSGPGPSTATAGDAAASGNLVSSLTLSASGITFLAGFGAEAVFTLLEGLVARVFSMPK